MDRSIGRAAPRALAAAVAATMCAAAPAGPPALAWQSCWLRDWPHEARCGILRRPLDPAAPAGRQIDLHVALVPALAQRAAADPVFFFAGGPGQSAIDLAGMLSRRFAHLANRRDLVFIDQRGSGRSAPLRCPDDEEAAAWRALPDTRSRLASVAACRQRLEREAHGDLRRYTTAIASLDVEAVREALGVERLNAIGFSYGTRVVLDYQRQYPQRLRRVVLDGVAPPDQQLPHSTTVDRQAALDALFDDCERQSDCARRYPALREQWRALLAGLPREAQVENPLSGRPQALTMTRELVLGLAGAPLYSPALAAALPQAIADARADRWQPLLGLAAALGGAGGIASGMHFSVICSEDFAPAGSAESTEATDRAKELDAQDDARAFYRQACAGWPRGAVPPQFYTVAPARAPVMLLSGGADPVTPPRHAARVARLLGPKTRHERVDGTGHGVLALACARDAATAFIGAPDDDAALGTEFRCPQSLPRPPAFVSPGLQR